MPNCRIAPAGQAPILLWGRRIHKFDFSFWDERCSTAGASVSYLARSHRLWTTTVAESFSFKEDLGMPLRGCKQAKSIFLPSIIYRSICLSLFDTGRLFVTCLHIIKMHLHASWPPRDASRAGVETSETTNSMIRHQIDGYEIIVSKHQDERIDVSMGDETTKAPQPARTKQNNQTPIPNNHHIPHPFLGNAGYPGTLHGANISHLGKKKTCSTQRWYVISLHGGSSQDLDTWLLTMEIVSPQDLNNVGPLPNARLFMAFFNGGFLDPNCPYHAMGSHPPGKKAPRSCLTTWHLQLCLWCFRWKHHALLVEKPPRTRRRFETLNKNAIQIDNATKTKKYFCWQKCSISTMRLVEGIWLADFWFQLVQLLSVCWWRKNGKKNNRKKDLAIEEELLEAA